MRCLSPTAGIYSRPALCYPCGKVVVPVEKRSSVKRLSARQGAWRKAVAFGCDLPLLEENLRRTPAERLQKHARALATLGMLKTAGEKQRVRS